MRRLSGTLLAVVMVALSTLGCGEFGLGIAFKIQDLWPLHTPVPDPADAEILENGLTIAENGNAGTYFYTCDVEYRHRHGSTCAYAAVTHEFSDDRVTVTHRGLGPATYLRIAPNTYQTTTHTVVATLVYNAHGYTRYYEYRERDGEGLYTYELFPLEARFQELPTIPELEREALIALYHNTGGPNWVYKEYINDPVHDQKWLSETPPCSWQGVTCHSDGYVTFIYRPHSQISGTLPLELANLSHLDRLDLSGNQISGSLLPELGNLTNLTRLQIDHNPLNGSLPLELSQLTNLETFSFHETEICEPSDPDFQAWLDGIEWLERTGVVCPDQP